MTGGAGYKGCVLVPKLLDAGHWVTVVDALWFGNALPAHPALTVVQRDIRDGVDCSGQQAVIHLAGIANDPCGELDAKLTWEVNVLAHMLLCDAAARAGVRQFIFASSASVYGIKGDEEITEGMTLEPVSDYNKTKMVAERVLLSYADRMIVQIARPATVCGLSPRMRLDTMVNMLTVQAMKNGKITAHCGEHGGGLMRPNIHIEDITDLYVWLLAHPGVHGIMNAGFENISASDTAAMISKSVPAEIEITCVKDKRSYKVNSAKLLGYGFKPAHTVAGAIEEIRAAWQAGRLTDQDSAYNLRWMRSQGLVRDAA
ncbi:MAG: NAD-dependent epimerase/dehydratase family protein [Burkholderiales bacterium]